MEFLSNLNLHFSPLILFGLILLLGLLGGEITRLNRFLPRISGYIAIGFLVGPGAFNLVTPSVLIDIRIFVDIALGLILFDLGRQLDFKWLHHDRGLLYMSLAESSLTFVLVFVTLIILDLPWLSAAFAASIAMTTSAAVIMMVSHDLSSEGPVTRRVLMMTSINNLFGITVFTLLIPLARSNIPLNMHPLIYDLFRIFGSVILGITIFYLTKIFAHIVGKKNEYQFVLFVSTVLLTIGLARILHLSMILSLLTFGIASRNLDFKNTFVEFDFKWGFRIAFILLFVVTGIQLNLKGLVSSGLIVISFILIRSFAKSAGIWMFAKKSRITRQQTIAISLALTPMAGLAMGMASTLSDFNENLGREMSVIIASVVAILHILGPIATQYAFLRTGETIRAKLAGKHSHE